MPLIKDKLHIVFSKINFIDRFSAVKQEIPGFISGYICTTHRYIGNLQTVRMKNVERDVKVCYKKAFLLTLSKLG